MQKKQTKEQPMKVLLSKQDLVNLLIILKDFVSDEIFGPYRLDMNHRMEMLDRRVRAVEKDVTAQESKHILSCTHSDIFNGIWYSSTNTVLGLVYKCRWCKRERIKTTILLSRKEKRALRKILGAGKI